MRAGFWPEFFIIPRKTASWASILAIVIGAGFAGHLLADTTLNSFNDFTSTELYASWASPSATVASGPDSYSVTASGYGSNYKYNPVPDNTDSTTVQLTVTLSGAAEADGKLGVLINLVDADGTEYIYAWYGQTLGSHVLTAPVNSPSSVPAAGTVGGLDLTTLTHLHMQLDPSSYSGQYTVEWQDLSLITPPVDEVIQILSETYNRTSREFTLAWSSLPASSYSIQFTSNLTNAFTPLVMDIPASSGASTTNTVIIPAGSATGFLRVSKQP